MIHQHINNTTPFDNSLDDKEKDVSSDSPFEYDYSLPFKEFVLTVVNPVTKRKLTIGSHSYWVLYALYHGNNIDDYENKPVNPHTGNKINNVSQRVFDLKSKFAINRIKSMTVEGEKFVEFCLKR